MYACGIDSALAVRCSFDVMTNIAFRITKNSCPHFINCLSLQIHWDDFKVLFEQQHPGQKWDLLEVAFLLA